MLKQKKEWKTCNSYGMLPWIKILFDIDTDGMRASQDD